MEGAARFIASDAGGLPSPITFAESQVYTQDVWHMARALSGGWASFLYFSFWWRGRHYAIDFFHQGQGANCTVWNASCAGATRGTATLANGNRTDVELAQAAMAAIQALGVTTVTRSGARLEIDGATNLVLGPGMTTDETRRGMRGRQRVDFGAGTSTAPSYGSDVDALVSVHIPGPASAGRITGVYVLSTAGARTGNLRMGIANGPAYSASPGAFSGGIEGIAVRNSNLYFFPLPEPMTLAALQDKWITFMTNTAAGIRVETRIFAAVPTGRGELAANESNVIDTTAGRDPNTNTIYSGGAYTPTVFTNSAAYTAVGYLFELPDANGNYVGDGGANTYIGYHGAFNAGTPGTFGPTIVDGISDTPRQPIPWNRCRIRRLEQACTAIAATEDFGFAFYDCSLSNPAVYPFNVAPTLIATIGAINASTGAGYKAYDCDIELVNVTVLGMNSVGGNRDGTIPATTITIAFTAPGAQVAWLNGWVDGQADWDDMVVERGGLGVNAQYVTQPGGMPFGNPNGTGTPGAPAFPVVFLLAPPAGGTVDGTGSNHPRIRWRITHAGAVAA